MKNLSHFLIALVLFACCFHASSVWAQSNNTAQVSTKPDNVYKLNNDGSVFEASSSRNKPKSASADKGSRAPESAKPLPVSTAPPASVAKTKNTVSSNPVSSPAATSPQPSPAATTNAVALPKITREDMEVMSGLGSGSVVVSVASNDNAVYRVGLSERGVVVIDFPVSDPVYKVFSVSDDYVTVDCTKLPSGKCANAPTDAIVLRPGGNFHALEAEDTSSTVVSVQRVSGLVVSFIVYPVKTISQNDNYIVVRYNLSDVINARQKAGLAVNLRPSSTAAAVSEQTTQVIDQKTGEAKFINAGSLSDKSVGASAVAAQTPLELADPLKSAVIAELQRVSGAPNADLRFTKPVYGLSLARAATANRTADTTIEVIAIRNTLAQPIRLSPKQPVLVVENREKRNETIDTKQIALLHIAFTAEADEILQPGQIYYYAFAYTSPILGAKQVLRVTFAQRDADDSPASLELGGLAR